MLDWPADGRSIALSSNRHSAPVRRRPGRLLVVGAGVTSIARLLAVLGRLTERDRLLCRLLDDHRVLTTAQVADVGFTGERRARMRLAELYALDVLDRFRPQAWGKPGSVPLGPRSARRRSRRRRARRRPGRPRLAARAWSTTSPPASASPTWSASTASSPPCSARPAPGPAATWRSGGPSGAAPASGARSSAPTATASGARTAPRLPFLLEYDNGTERLDRLAAKLDGYAKLAAAAGHPNWVLFTFPGPRREAEARRVLAHPTVPVATTARAPGATPDGTVWLPVTSTGHRLRLAQLASLPINGR